MQETMKLNMKLLVAQELSLNKKLDAEYANQVSKLNADHNDVKAKLNDQYFQDRELARERINRLLTNAASFDKVCDKRTIGLDEDNLQEGQTAAQAVGDATRFSQALPEVRVLMADILARLEKIEAATPR